MIYKDFEDYLMNRFSQETNLLDDDQPDGFESWLADLDIEELIILANIYGMEKNKEGMTEGFKIWEDRLPNLEEY